jgi:dipeptidyl-peptidase 4
LFYSVGNASLAHRLQGKLLLSYGEMDEGVHGSMTLQVVDALIRANKDFDLIVMTNVNHGLMDLREGREGLDRFMQDEERRGNGYFTRRRWDYFVEHLLGAEPVHGFAVQ